MNDQYELYCLADRLFYDSPDNRQSEHADFPVAGREVPVGWEHQPTDTWMHYAPGVRQIAMQGWKIHVSARLEDADRVLGTVWDYCVPRDIPFKFLRSAPVVTMLNSKAAPRGSSGKLVTIYPHESELELALKELDTLLRGVEGPYILSDLRYADGPLYVRYGGFVPRHCLDDSGEQVTAIENADGELVPDVRGPSFVVPPWVQLPEFLKPQLDARNAVTTGGLPYEIEAVMHFSNGGGVYLGWDRRTGERVVLKEARPHAGLDAGGRDAVARLQHERDMLQRLRGLDAVPEYRDYFTLGEHHFLVMEFVDGNPLQRQLVQRYPLTRANCSAASLAEYTAWVLEMLPRVRDAVESLHRRGVVFGDLHPNNILVTETGRVVLIDFEVALPVEDQGRSLLAHPAFQAPPNRCGAQVDLYSLACLCFGLFAPQATIMLPLANNKITQLAHLITTTFPVPPEIIATALRTIQGDATTPPASGPNADADVFSFRGDAITAPASGLNGDADGLSFRGGAVVPAASGPNPGVDAPSSTASSSSAAPSSGFEVPPGWPSGADAMVRAILATATPGRRDRLFPGDIAQFRPGGGVNFAHGAAGVLYALDAAGAGRYPEYEGWLLNRVSQLAPGTPLGFYDGLHGIAHTLDRFGHRDTALDLVDRTMREDWRRLDTSLSTGLAGIGLNLLHLGLDAQAVIETCADRLPDDVPELSGGANPRAGLMHGSSGSALLFLHAYEHSGDHALLDLADRALRQDLRRCIRTQDGSRQVNQGWRTLPYLEEGSVGIALVLDRFLTHRPDEELRADLDALLLVTRCGYFVQPGLFAGRAGLVLAQPDLIPGLDWHALPYRDGLAFPGDQLLRLSMDFATGTAGVLLAVSGAPLPFLRPPGEHTGSGAPL